MTWSGKFNIAKQPNFLEATNWLLKKADTAGHFRNVQEQKNRGEAEKSTISFVQTVIKLLIRSGQKLIYDMTELAQALRGGYRGGIWLLLLRLGQWTTLFES